jgi:hypothetical protein
VPLCGDRQTNAKTATMGKPSAKSRKPLLTGRLSS